MNLAKDAELLAGAAGAVIAVDQIAKGLESKDHTVSHLSRQLLVLLSPSEPTNSSGGNRSLMRNIIMIIVTIIMRLHQPAK